MSDELLDIVNEHDEVIGQGFRADVLTKKLGCRVINAFLINNKNELWIPVRSPRKKLFPSCLDMSVGGFVAAGETYKQAFEREAKEELNIDLQKYEFTEIAKLSPIDNVSCHMMVYIIDTNKTPLYNTNDFVSGQWLSIEEIKEKIASGQPAKGDLLQLLEIVKKTI
ncbi:NUDIX domain-containing protein [Candidatus Babeliales bacterium]|nr:NUDIX domain-containing protein [Candidatus Babeliales bacterium]